ncbi:hypothetical protein QJS04_geneDACA017114 [Acorus gramineus]|uniref:Uncharacterized protein n=1 Tax=Acorus gramineus TaxID=55184 RepID=A0AAV9AWN1_ACOGR|nr:hypothetical protein QJS04_geneDACA017114 [Acorus gramineus]
METTAVAGESRERELSARELGDVIRCMSFLNKKLALALDGENASPSILMRPPGEYTFDELRAECRMCDALILRMLAGYGHQVPESKSTTKRRYAEIGHGEQGSDVLKTEMEPLWAETKVLHR